jgi:hypothetical protein
MTLPGKQRIPKDNRGSALLAALCFALVFILCLTSFIELCYTSLTASSRNFMSARCSEIAEMGIEEALFSQNYVNANNSIGNWTSGNSDNWNILNGNATVTMVLTDNGLVNSNANPVPLNLGNGATAQVVITVNNYANSSPPTTSPWITSQGIVSFPDGMGGTIAISRTITAGSATLPLTTAPLFVNAVAATGGSVTVASNSPANLIDSYNSSSGQYSSATSTFSAIVLSTSSTVYLNNAILHGYAVAPLNGIPPPVQAEVSYQASAIIKGANTLVGTLIDGNQIIANPIPFQPTFSESFSGHVMQPIAGIYSSTSLGTAGTTTYYSTPIVGLSSPNQTLAISGNVVLEVTDPTASATSFTISQGAVLSINNNSSLQILLEAGGMSLVGSTYWNGGVTNNNVTPKASQFVVLAGNNPGGVSAGINLALTGDFYGAVYAPNQPITLADGGFAYYGSIVGQTVSITNTPFHYDTALQVPVTVAGNMAFQDISSPAVAVSNIQETVP